MTQGNIPAEQSIMNGVGAAQISETRLQTLVDSVRDFAIYLLDVDGRIVTWNAGAQRLKGYTAEEAIGMSMSHLHTPEARAAGVPEKELARALADGIFDERAWRVRKDGSKFLAEVSVTPVRDADGKHIGFAKVTRDITEQQKLEERLQRAQKMESVGQLAGGIAHDFNNLLGVVIGSLDLMTTKTKSDPELTTLVEEALSAALSGSDLTRKLLSFARRQPLTVSEVDVNELIAGMASMLSRTLGETITVQVTPAANLHLVAADRAQIEAAILNLTLNARDAMPSGGRITIETANRELDMPTADAMELNRGEYVMISVTDTGKGIPADLLPHVMEPFFTTKGVGEGTGLGLSMVFGFAKQSGGHVNIYSEVDHGTTVRIYLPRSETSQPSESAEPEQAAERKPLVLVVDDNAALRRTTVAQLAHLGYQTLQATDGPSALEIIKNTPDVDILFTDIVMPGGMTGFQLGHAAKQVNPRIRTLYATGFAEAAVLHGRDVGSDLLLSKPYRKDELAEKLSAVLSSGSSG